MARQRRSIQQDPPRTGQGALISSVIVLSLLLAYQCSEPTTPGPGLLEHFVTPSALSLPKSASKNQILPVLTKETPSQSHETDEQNENQ